MKWFSKSSKTFWEPIILLMSFFMFFEISSTEVLFFSSLIILSFKTFKYWLRWAIKFVLLTSSTSFFSSSFEIICYSFSSLKFLSFLKWCGYVLVRINSYCKRGFCRFNTHPTWKNILLFWGSCNSNNRSRFIRSSSGANASSFRWTDGKVIKQLLEPQSVHQRHLFYMW